MLNSLFYSFIINVMSPALWLEEDGKKKQNKIKAFKIDSEDLGEWNARFVELQHRRINEKYSRWTNPLHVNKNKPVQVISLND